MQKIKNENGITLVALIVTIIVLLILASISINLGLDSIESTKDRKLQAEIEIIQQACITEYTKARQIGNLEKFSAEELEADSTKSNIPSNFIGEYVEVEDLPTIGEEEWAFSSNIDKVEAYKGYFRLTSNDLEKLGISGASSTYIVNYYTGEVYNETIGVSSDDVPLYIKSKNQDLIEDTTDNTSFVDDTTWGD